MTKREMRCPHKDKVSDCADCMAELNAIPGDFSTDSELSIKRDLQLLKADDGNYVLTSLGSMYALPKLIEYIKSREAKLISEAQIKELDAVIWFTGKQIKKKDLKILLARLESLKALSQQREGEDNG